MISFAIVSEVAQTRLTPARVPSDDHVPVSFGRFSFDRIDVAIELLLGAGE